MWESRTAREEQRERVRKRGERERPRSIEPGIPTIAGSVRELQVCDVAISDIPGISRDFRMRRLEPARPPFARLDNRHHGGRLGLRLRVKNLAVLAGIRWRISIAWPATFSREDESLDLASWKRALLLVFFFFFSTSTRSRRWLSRSSILFDISPPRSRDDASLTSLSIRECSSAWFDVGLARARMTEIDRASRLRDVLSMESSIGLPRDICTWLAIRFEEKSQWVGPRPMTNFFLRVQI